LGYTGSLQRKTAGAGWRQRATGVVACLMVRRDATDVRLPLGGGAPAARWASPAGESPAPVGSGSEDARSVPRQSQMDSSALRTSLPHLSINAGGAPVVGVASKRKTRKRRAARCARL